MAETIKIATVNCQGLSTPSKRKDVLNYNENKKYSILCLQDTHFIQDLEPYIEAHWGYKCVFNSYASNSRGVAVFFNNDFELVLHREKRDNSGNILALDISVDQNRLTLIKQNKSTEGCSKLKRSVDMTSSGKNGLNIRTNASPKWDRTRCPEE